MKSSITLVIFFVFISLAMLSTIAKSSDDYPCLINPREHGKETIEISNKYLPFIAMAQIQRTGPNVHAVSNHVGTFQPKQERCHNTTNNGGANNQTNEFMSAHNLLPFIINLVLCITTICLVKITFNTASRQLRAYVHIDVEHEERPFFNRDGCITIPITIKNYGKTPANSLKLNALVHTLITNNTPDFNGGSVGCLAPGQSFKSYPSLIVPITDGAFNDITNGTETIFVWGFIEYKDIFKTTHTTSFRNKLVFYGTNIGECDITHCGHGNEIT